MLGAGRRREKGGKRGGAGARSASDSVRRRGKKGGARSGRGRRRGGQKDNRTLSKKLTKKDVFLIFFSK